MNKQAVYNMVRKQNPTAWSGNEFSLPEEFFCPHSDVFFSVQNHDGFFHREIVHYVFIELGTMVNQHWYLEIPKMLSKSVWRKGREQVNVSLWQCFCIWCVKCSWVPGPEIYSTTWSTISFPGIKLSPFTCTQPQSV